MRTVLLFVSVAVFCRPAMPQEIELDRIAVTVGAQAITEQEILDEIRITAFLNGEPVDLSSKFRRAAAERLIDQTLIRRDMKAIRYPEPENSEADRLLAELKRTRFRGDAAYRAALGKYGIDERELKSHLLWQLAALRFTDFRFRPGAPEPNQVLAQRLEKEFQERGQAQAAAATQGRRPRTDESDGLPQSVDRQMDEWLKQARERTRIKFREEAFAQ